MNLPPLSLEFCGIPCYRSGLLLWRGVKQTFGRVWKIIDQTANQLYQLILLINKAVNSCFFIPRQNSDWNSDAFLDPDPKLRSRKTPNQENETFLIGENFSLQTLDGLDEDSYSQDEDSYSQDESSYNQENNHVPSSHSHFILDFNQDSLILMEIVAANLKELKKRISDLEKEDGATSSMEDQIMDIMMEIVDPILKSLEEMEIKELGTLQEYLDLTDQLEKKYLSLEHWNSDFKEKSPKGDQLVQMTRHSLEERRNELEQELSIHMKRCYKPNDDIQSDGHCLFWSINEQVKNKKTPKYYRTLAAGFIRNHSKKFQSGIDDALSTNHVKFKITSYTRVQGGKKVWSEKLKKTLERRPTKVDFYCNCLENTNLWGGMNEIIALSQVLEVPFLVFTQNKTAWRFDSKIGLSTFEKAPILLHYNGTSHYRNLILK